MDKYKSDFYASEQELASLPITVSELNELIKDIFDGIPQFRNVCIQGEISNFKNHYSTGHFYFSLKDESSSIRAVMFRAYASRLRFLPENGMKVTLTGRIGVFARDGLYQIYCETMEPLGVGSLYAAFEQLKLRLSKEGLFEPSMKKQLPVFPKRIGVVTSATGAAVRDIINVLGRRCPLSEVILFPCLVQGTEAPDSIVSGIRYFNEISSADVLIVGRGGGSIEDLWAFNDEKVAREIYSSNIPIISAVGHETDFTIADFVADVRAPTPSAAAELAVPDLSEIKVRISSISSHMKSGIVFLLNRIQDRLNNYSKSAVLNEPMFYIDEKNMLLTDAYEKLEEAMLKYTENKLSTLGARVELLNSLSPLSVLARGYSVAYTKNSKPIISAGDVSVGENMTVKTSNGKIFAEITGISM